MKPKTSNMDDFVYERILLAIVKRYIRQGSRLIEKNLAEQLGVSRTPVRTALRRLDHEGIVNFVPKRGAVVVKPTKEEIKDTFEVRIGLEKMAVKLAIDNISKGAIENLKMLAKQETQYFELGKVQEYCQVNKEFHLEIARATGNHVLVEYVESVINRTTVYLILFDQFESFFTNTSEPEHLEIVEALGAGDVRRAEGAMDAHLRKTMEGLDAVEIVPEDYLSA